MDKDKVLNLAKQNLLNFMTFQRDCLKLDIEELEEEKFTDYYEFLNKKTEFVLSYLKRLAIHADVCPFCLEHKKSKNECADCLYGKTHGICYEDGSVFLLIIDVVILLGKILELLYIPQAVVKANLNIVQTYLERVINHLEIMENKFIK